MRCALCFFLKKTALFVGPYSIRQLVAETLNTTAVRLVWVKPLQDKAEYTYRVETTGFDFQNITIEEDNATISELTPGANNSFCVLVMAANGIEGEPVCISRYTGKKLCYLSLLYFISNRQHDWSLLILPPPHINRAWDSATQCLQPGLQ